MATRFSELPVRSRALLSLAINAALALGWNAAEATAPAVINCNSSGIGSLSAAISDAMTVDGDVIDMTSLKHVCSKITVDDVAIHKDVIIEGPGAKYLTIDGANTARLFHHDGVGTLTVSGMTLANGSYSSASRAKGGCLHSTGNISLIDVDISNCAAKSTGDRAFGGGVYAGGSLHLLRSTITKSRVIATGAALAYGGGAYAKDSFSALYSIIDNNTAGGVDMGYGVGGGIATPGDAMVHNTTISANKADAAGAIFLNGGVSHVATIADSTVSGNTATFRGGIDSDTTLVVTNSTVAFNSSLAGVSNNGAGIYTKWQTILSSSIIAGNSGQDGANDLAGAAAATVSGSDNIVFKSSLMLPMSNNTTGVCPKLDVLADNGGPTRTHGLKPDSPAIDKGSAPMSLTIDQRLEPRKTGPQSDIGAVEWKVTDKLEGVLVSGVDGLCDQ